MAVEYPVLMLLRQNGKEEDGWRGTPFYWPVLVVPQKIDKVLYALNGADLSDKEEIRAEDLGVYSGMGENEVLKLTLCTDPFFDFIFGFKDYESREITINTASRYIEQDASSPVKYKFRTDVKVDKDSISGIESPNGGVFPFVLRRYNYILFRDARDMSGSLLLVKLKSGDDFANVTCSPKTETDNIIDRRNNSTPYEKDSLCDWLLDYNVAEVVAFKLNKNDTALFNDLKEEFLNSGIITDDSVKQIKRKMK